MKLSEPVGMGAAMLATGIGMLFFDETRSLAPFLVGFGAALVARRVNQEVGSNGKEKKGVQEEVKGKDDKGGEGKSAVTASRAHLRKSRREVRKDVGLVKRKR